jgi:tetratricopeptide (TPR) repeat protein
MDATTNRSDLSTEAQQHFEQAYAYEEQEDFENALRECELAIQLAPGWAEPHNLRGIVLDGLGRTEEAIVAYREAIRLDPAFREAQDNLSEAEAELRREKSQIKPIARRNGGQRPKWVVAAAIWLVLLGLISFQSGARMLGRMSQIDWIRTADRLGVEAGALEMVLTIQTYTTLALGVLVFVSVVGIWTMKKWGTVIYGVFIVLTTVGLVVGWTQPQGQLDFAVLMFLVSYIAIGLGLLSLWGKGKLT